MRRHVLYFIHSKQNSQDPKYYKTEKLTNTNGDTNDSTVQCSEEIEIELASRKDQKIIK